MAKYDNIISQLMVVVVMLCVAIAHVSGEFPRLDHGAKPDGSLSVMVIGDWGRKGEYNQSQLADQMGITAEKNNVDFVISTGDNFYPKGLIDEHDEAFDQSFSNVYTAPSLQKQWYSVLGNHDYRGNALAQLSPVLKLRNSKWLCLKSYILNTETADFFFIDTTPFQTKYFTNPKDNVYDWRGVLPRDQYLSTVMRDLESALAESHAKWKIVVGHHTIKSVGVHGDTQELVQMVLPILQANGVDLYINGHDHCLEHMSIPDSKIQFMTSGGGSKAWKGEYDWSNNPDEVKFYYDGQGFMTMEITPIEIDIKFYDIAGTVMHKWSASKSHYFSSM